MDGYILQYTAFDAQILRAKCKMMSLFGFFQQAVWIFGSLNMTSYFHLCEPTIVLYPI